MDTAPLSPLPASAIQSERQPPPPANSLAAWAASLPLARIGIVAVAAFLRLYALDLRPPHFDEGVNGWFLDKMAETGFYRYDPTNYHGPLHFYVLFVFEHFLGRNLWALRLPVALVGILTVDWLFRFERFFDDRVCALAALAMTLSPGFLYYQRDAIHETWLVYFLILFFWGLCGLWQEGRRRYLWAAGLALAGMVLTKETYVIHLACLAGALPCLMLLESFWPSRVALLNQADGASPRLFARQVLFRPPAAQLWTGLELGAVVTVGLIAIVVFYSGTGLHFAGLGGLFTTFAPWMHKAKVGEGHNKPFWYWLKLLAFNEPWAAFGLLTCLRWACPGTSDWRLRLLAIYAVATLLAYSLIPYKTPWCLLSFGWPFLVLAAAVIVELRSRWVHYALGLAVTITLALSVLSTFWAVRLNYFEPTAEKGEDYVYVQTFPDINHIVDPLLALAREDPLRHKLRGIILCGSTYPLPWMLGDFTSIGYYSDALTPPNYHADFLLVTQKRVAAAEAGLNAPYFRETVRLRSSLDPLNLYFRASLFGHLFPGRNPEFVPSLPGHQLIPPS